MTMADLGVSNRCAKVGLVGLKLCPGPCWSARATGADVWLASLEVGATREGQRGERSQGDRDAPDGLDHVPPPRSSPRRPGLLTVILEGVAKRGPKGV